MKYILLLCITLTTSLCRATDTIDKLVAQNSRMPVLAPKCSIGRGLAMCATCPSPLLLFCGASTRDNKLEQLAYRLNLDGKILTHAVADKSSRRALAAEYMARKHLVFKNKCCPEAFPVLRKTGESLLTGVYFSTLLARDVFSLETDVMAEAFASNPGFDLAYPLIAPWNVTYFTSSRASKCVFDTGEICCSDIVEGSPDEEAATDICIASQNSWLLNKAFSFFRQGCKSPTALACFPLILYCDPISSLFEKAAIRFSSDNAGLVDCYMREAYGTAACIANCAIDCCFDQLTGRYCCEDTYNTNKEE